MESTPYKVTVLGGASMDLKARATTAGHGHCKPGRIFECPGGVARNIAENLARISVQTTLVTAIGRDDAGRRIVADSSLAGVNMVHSIQSDRFPTSRFVAVQEESGDVARGIMDSGIIELITADHVARLEEIFKTSSLVVCDSSLPHDSLERIQESCHRLGIPRVIVPASSQTLSRIKPFLKHSLMVALNRHEAGMLTGQDTKDDAGVEKAARELQTMGANLTMITLGADGVMIRSAAEVLRLPSLRRHVTDPMGAGDAFVAGFIYGFLRKLPLLKALEIGQFTSALTLDTSYNVHPKLSIDYIHGSIV